MARARAQSDRGGEGGVLMRALMAVALVLLGVRLALPAGVAMIDAPRDRSEPPALSMPAESEEEEAPAERGHAAREAAAALFSRLAPFS